MSKLQHIVFHDIKSLSREELEDQYAIEIYDDGVVWDSIENREFKDLTSWAHYTAEQDQDNNFGCKTKMQKHQDYDE